MENPIQQFLDHYISRLRGRAPLSPLSNRSTHLSREKSLLLMGCRGTLLLEALVAWLVEGRGCGGNTESCCVPCSFDLGHSFGVLDVIAMGT